MPVRIQRKRTKGWKAPEGAVYVGRPSKWGNPWSVTLNMTREEAVDVFRRWMEVATVEPSVTGGRRGSMKELARLTLRGKDLMCFCPLDQPCHADVLLEIANTEPQS